MSIYTAVQTIPSFNTDAVKYYDPSVYRLRGEWKVINCGDIWAYAFLMFTPIDVNATTLPYPRYVDNEKIKLVSKNAFNITRLTYYDSGQYMCINAIMNGTELIPWDIKRYNLIVLNEGKTCMHTMDRSLFFNFF